MSEAKSTVEALTTTRVPTENDDHSNSVRNGLLCAFAVAVCVLIANPAVNMPYLDEFSYAKTALDFARTGHIVYNGWATAMLGWQIPWGALFIKIFGFSFTVVRFSMLPIAMVTVYLFHQILRRFGINPGNAILGRLDNGTFASFLPWRRAYMTDVRDCSSSWFASTCVSVQSPQNDQSRCYVAMFCNGSQRGWRHGAPDRVAWGACYGAIDGMGTARTSRHEGRRGSPVDMRLRWRTGAPLFNQQPYAVPTHVLSGSIWYNQQPYSVPTHILPGSMKIRDVCPY